MKRATARTIARRTAFGAVTVYAALIATLFLNQRRLLFPGAVPAPLPNVSFAATFHGDRDGVRYVGLHRRARHAAAVTYVYLHGNGEIVDGGRELFERLGDSDAGMASLEYAGYGALHDAPLGEWPMLASVDAGLQALYERGVRPDRVVLLGRSLGSGFAVAMAARGHGIAMALFSPYTSIPDAAASHYPLVPVHLLVRDRFDSARRAAQVRIPTVIFHGDRDDTVPVELGRALARRVQGARYIEVRGAGHDDLFVHPDVDVLRDAFQFGADAVAAKLARERTPH